MPQRPPPAPKRSVDDAYFAALAAGSAVLALLPIGIVLAAFILGGFRGNPFDENGVGAVLWLLLVTIPAGLVLFAAGALVGVVVALVRGRRS